MAVEFDPNDPLTIADPYPAYARLRTQDPVHHDAALGRWFLSRYVDVSAALRDPRFSAVRPEPDLERLPPPLRRSVEIIHRSSSRWMLNLDPPEHTRLRGIHRPWFVSGALEPLRARIQELADDLLDRAPEDGRLDIVNEFASPLTTAVVHELIGVPPEDDDEVARRTQDLAVALSANTGTPGRVERLNRMGDALEALAAFSRRQLDQRCGQHREDLLGHLTAAEAHGEIRDEQELHAAVAFLLVAARTTTNLIANGTLALLRHPDQLRRLRDEPALIPSAVEELVRYDSPIQTIARVAVEDIELGGAAIRRGDMVMFGLGAANRDPAQFVEPDRLDVARSPNRHLAFGHGAHFCVGAPLARLTGPVAIATLLRRRQHFRLESDAPEWRRLPLVRSLVALPVR